jgi:hypothetical protein
MRPTHWLRAASIFTIVHSIAHTAGGVYGAIAPGAQQTAVDAMKANTFPLVGFTRSYWDFHMGFGLAITIFLAVEAIVFWLLGNLARDSDANLRPILATFLVGYVVLAINSFLYFFAPPVIVELLIAACLGAAIVSMKRVAVRTA